MNNNYFHYRIYGRSKGRNKKNFQYDKYRSIIKNRAIKYLKVTDNNILDIGSGYGESTLYLAENYINSTIIACENFFDGNYKLINETEKKQLNNIYIHNGNVHQFLDKLTEGKYFSLIWILFPDPWPKKKHLKRRLINLFFFNKILKYLKKNAKIYIATDSKSYLKEILFLVFQLRNQLIWENQRKLGWDYNNTSLVQTKYYKKAIKNGSNPFIIKLRTL